MTQTNAYEPRDHAAQGEHYMRHLDAMTREGLHAKSAIAGELAHRDIVIIRLRAELARLHREKVNGASASDALPPHRYTLASGGSLTWMPGYSAEEMRAYRAEGVAAERARLAAMIRSRSRDTYAVLLREHDEAAGWVAEDKGA